MDVLAGVQYEFKEVLERNMQLFFCPPRTGSYEIICNSNKQLQVKIYDGKSEDFLLSKSMQEHCYIEIDIIFKSIRKMKWMLKKTHIYISK